MSSQSKSELIASSPDYPKGPRSNPWEEAWSECVAECQKWQRQQDERRRDAIAKAHAHNHENCPLLKLLSAELENMIWNFAIAPEYDPGDRSLRPANFLNQGSLVCRYPDGSILLASKAIYDEALGMYTHAVNRFWSESSFSLPVPPPRRHSQCEDHWQRCLYPLIRSLKNDKLRMVTRLYITGLWVTWDSGPFVTLRYVKGEWSAKLNPARRPPTYRKVVLYEETKKGELKSCWRVRKMWNLYHTRYWRRLMFLVHRVPYWKPCYCRMTQARTFSERLI